MTSPKSLCGIASLLLLALLVVVSSDTVAQVGTQETSIPGKQFMIAKYTSTPPVIDGVFSPGEWQGAISVYVDGSTPATAPGVVPKDPSLPFLFPPDSPPDSSFTIYTLYDDNNLYIAVDVNDDIVICDGPVPFLDDDAEIMIDGDRRPGDVHMALICGPDNPSCTTPVINNEGFQLVTSVCNQSLTAPPNNPSIVWESKAGLRPHGYVVEFRIPLDSINTIDTSWFTNPFPGSGFRRPLGASVASLAALRLPFPLPADWRCHIAFTLLAGVKTWNVPAGIRIRHQSLVGLTAPVTIQGNGVANITCDSTSLAHGQLAGITGVQCQE